MCSSIVAVDNLGKTSEKLLENAEQNDIRQVKIVIGFDNGSTGLFEINLNHKENTTKSDIQLKSMMNQQNQPSLRITSMVQNSENWIKNTCNTSQFLKPFDVTKPQNWQTQVAQFGDYTLIGDISGSVVLRNLDWSKSQKIHEGSITGLKFMNDKNSVKSDNTTESMLLVSSGEDGRIKLWHLNFQASDWLIQIGEWTSSCSRGPITCLETMCRFDEKNNTNFQTENSDQEKKKIMSPMKKRKRGGPEKSKLQSSGTIVAGDKNGNLYFLDIMKLMS